jgi:aquaporin Z
MAKKFKEEIMKKYIAEGFGTFTLVLFGCGSAVIAGSQIGVLGIAFAFGFALIAMAYSIGGISGCHINPAVSVGFFASGRMSIKDLIAYIVCQFLGAIAAALVLSLIVKTRLAGYDIAVSGLGQNGWGAGYLGAYGMTGAILFESIATFIFVYLILKSTRDESTKPFAGLFIGITLIVIHIVGIQITGTSVNPARSLAPALIVGGNAMAQVWLFLLFPTLGGLVAGLVTRPCSCSCCCNKSNE